MLLRTRRLSHAKEIFLSNIVILIGAMRALGLIYYIKIMQLMCNGLGYIIV